MKKIVFALIISMIVFASCKRDYKDDGYVGTAYISASKDFAITTGFEAIANGGSINNDYAVVLDGSDEVSFKATFNETVSWEVLIEGLKSSATYLVKGTSSEINTSNSIWTGIHDGTFFFEDGDSIKTTLRVIGYNQTYTDFFKIAVAKNYTTDITNKFVFIPASSFELGSFAGFPTQFDLNNSTTAVEAPVMQSTDTRAPHGLYFCRVIGHSNEANGYFVGGVQHRKRYFINWTDPEQIYVNLFVNGIDNLLPNSKPVAVLNFEFHEDDDGQVNDCPPPTNTSDYCPVFEDGWVYKIPINHSGWKLFSSKYSNLAPAEDAANGGSGNRVLQPNQIYRVQMGVVSNPPFNTVQADFDFACFTLGAPFDPKTF